MLLTEKYSDQIVGVISCYDRIVIQGTPPQICYPGGMTAYLNANGIRISGYPRFAEPLKNEIRENAERVAKENSLEIEFIRKGNVRRESPITKILETRGSHPGLIHIFSVTESCPTYRPRHNKNTHQTYLRADQGKCLHYYFYPTDPLPGLRYVRVPARCPFRLQIYFNGHNRPASEPGADGTGYTLKDNAFTNIGSSEDARRIGGSFMSGILHKKMNGFAERFCPVIRHSEHSYHRSVMQAEYAADIIFKNPEDPDIIYDRLIRTAVHTVKPENTATFSGGKLHPDYKDDTGSHSDTGIEGTRIRHSTGPASVKMYDKFGTVLRTETTVNNVSFFKHCRTAEHRDGTKSEKNAPLKKSICSLNILQELMPAPNHRYLQFISDIEDVSVGIGKLSKISETVIDNNRPYKGFNFFNNDDQKLSEAAASGEFCISGFGNKNLKKKLPGKNAGQVSRVIKRLWSHGLIKKIAKTYKYYLTRLGSQIITMGLKLRELVIIPELSR